MEPQKRESKEKVETKQLMQEIVPILKDYFVANVKEEEEKIKMSFLNGQEFYISVNEN